MLKQLKSFLSRSPTPAIPKPSPPCTHPYCAHRTHCIKTLGEDTLSQSYLSLSSDIHSLNTFISDHFSGHEVDYGWDSDYGWAEFCHHCHQECCQNCQGGIFTQVTNFEDVLTFESREVWICTPCRHGRCPGWKLKIWSLCGECGHAACAECMLVGDEKTGVVCCRCAKGERNLENRTDGETSVESVRNKTLEETGGA